jgi:prepilin-type N-terminal cleavage/methylation domain-containing protein
MKRRGKTGFTFIEVMVAITVMILGFLGLYESFQASGRLREAARETNVAMFKLQMTMEYLFCVPFDDITTILPEGATIDIVTLMDSSAGNDYRLNGEQITVAYENSAMDPIKFTITVDWNTRFGTPRQASLSSARMR